jgi:FKBP-type peptidyl-prolyl cis-trans isomerase FkpA
MKRMLFLLAAAVSLAGCNLDVPAPNNGNLEPSDPTKETFNPDLKINIATMKKTDAGTFYRDTIIGTGPTLTGDAVIIWSYLGLLKSGAGFATGSNETTNLATQVGGLRDGMRGMKVGGERIIVIPSVLGFGSAQVGIVPPNATLIYDVKLLGIP